MGVLDWLFGRRASGGASDAGVVEEAFNQVMAGVDVPKKIAKRLRPKFVIARQSGDPKKERQVLEDALDGVEWGETYFKTWRTRFISDGVFPYMWLNHAKTLIEDAPKPPACIDEALQYLRVTDMRKLLVDLAVELPKPKPRKRIEFEYLLRSTGATDAIIKAALPAFEDMLIDYPAKREREKCNLLAHTLSMRAYALQKRDTRLRLDAKAHPNCSECPVETAYAAKFIAGEISGEPPFFPGDRTSLIVDQSTIFGR